MVARVQVSFSPFTPEEYHLRPDGLFFAPRWTVRRVRQTWGSKLFDNLPFFAPRFPMYAEGIRKVANKHIADNGGAPAHFAPGTMAVAAFIDCNITETTRAGSGPATPGPGAPRRDPNGDIQRAIYTGWLHLCGIKYEYIVGPDGMILFMWGPTSVRHNDLFALDRSGILAKWAAGMVCTVLHNSGSIC